MFFTTAIKNQRLTDGSGYYPLSNVADYVLVHGDSGIVVSNGYFTFFNEATFPDLKEYGFYLTMNNVIDHLNKVKKELEN